MRRCDFQIPVTHDLVARLLDNACHVQVHGLADRRAGGHAVRHGLIVTGYPTWYQEARSSGAP
jgi:hypothetical protein